MVSFDFANERISMCVFECLVLARVECSFIFLLCGVSYFGRLTKRLFGSVYIIRRGRFDVARQLYWLWPWTIRRVCHSDTEESV